MWDGQYTFNGICNGTTKVGKPCQHRVVYANGYCKQHGGDSMEYMRERAKQIAKKLERRVSGLLKKHRRAMEKAGYRPPGKP